eukprot:CAMPEP_0198134824 /NCGR_PEP_ID=MMETSP1442-20131203/60276_1 /TAXON_ID= /ORGANISM="Craspedostauros australis, Strain CCMP3328" /LENGTH=100 /DNA_ID=CAMNT_0043795977 /DNA_START=894 /DNA_END=1196 /DNA_ORIENTATION=+
MDGVEEMEEDSGYTNVDKGNPHRNELHWMPVVIGVKFSSLSFHLPPPFCVLACALRSWHALLVDGMVTETTEYSYPSDSTNNKLEVFSLTSSVMMVLKVS